MKDTDSLRAACVLAYDLLRQPDCQIETPASMQHFVHQPQLSPRAMTVAHEALEREPQLRAYVARHAPEAGIDQPGLDWLRGGTAVPAAPAPPTLPTLPDPPAPPALRADRVIDVAEIDSLHRRIAELEAQLAKRSEQLAERTEQVAERTEQWRQALKDLSAAQK